ncbi:ABC transporter ATP-binding protein [Nocardia fluminea]|uniref:ABC transporter ATP-binding protein n=1 Tax=Nocardia fluminea TaxID=134984 RepID=UPI003432ED1F
MFARDKALMPPLQRRVFAEGLRSARGAIVAFVLITALASAAAVGAPLAIGKVVDSPNVTAREAFVGFVVFAAAVGASRMLQDVRTVLMNQVQQRVATVANTAVMRALIAADHSLVDTTNPARVAGIVSSFNGSTKMWVQMFLMALLGGLCDVALSFVVIGGYISWEVGLAVLGYGVLSVWLSLRANAVTSSFLKIANRKSNDVSGLLGNVISNMVSLKIFGGTEWVVRENQRHFVESRQGWLDFYRRRVGFGALQGGLLFFQYVLVFGLVLWQDGVASIGALIVLVMVLAQLNRPFELIANSLRDFTVAESMAAPLQELLETHTAPPATAGARVAEYGPLEVVLADVSYGFGDKATPVAEGINASMVGDRMHFITGASGVGKSTLMRVLLGIHHEYNGSITIGGAELSDIDPNSYWSAVGYVPQDPMMMNASVRDNINFGRDFDDLEVFAALEAVELTHKVAGLEDGLDFVIGERGGRLSGGERQRLALARALIGKPRLLLLDEASAALDEATEAAIFARLREIHDQMNVIAITHRTALIQNDDHRLDLTAARSLSMA